MCQDFAEERDWCYTKREANASIPTVEWARLQVVLKLGSSQPRKYKNACEDESLEEVRTVFIK